MVTLTKDAENRSDFADLLSNKCLQGEMPVSSKNHTDYKKPKNQINRGR